MGETIAEFKIWHCSMGSRIITALAIFIIGQMGGEKISAVVQNTAR